MKKKKKKKNLPYALIFKKRKTIKYFQVIKFIFLELMRTQLNKRKNTTQSSKGKFVFQKRKRKLAKFVYI